MHQARARHHRLFRHFIFPDMISGWNIISKSSRDSIFLFDEIKYEKSKYTKYKSRKIEFLRVGSRTWEIGRFPTFRSGSIVEWLIKW